MEWRNDSHTFLTFSNLSCAIHIRLTRALKYLELNESGKTFDPRRNPMGRVAVPKDAFQDFIGGKPST